MVDPTRIRIAKPGQGAVTTERVRFSNASDLTLVREIDRSSDATPNPKFTGVLSVVIPRTYGISTRRDSTTTHRLSSLLRWGDDSAARQRVLVGDSFNDEERGDNLSNPQSR